MLIIARRLLPVLCASVLCLSCVSLAGKPVPGPDKQAAGTVYGAMTGAVTGAIAGFNYASVSGPGAWVGAGLGGAFGMLSGMGQDMLEEEQIRRQEELAELEEASWVQKVLGEHYKTRLKLHPARDIYPADLFFKDDDEKITQEAISLVRGMALLVKDTKPWSKLVVASYVTAKENSPVYAAYLAKSRAEQIASNLVRFGINPRRLGIRPVTVKDPILVDSTDDETKYAQAIELIYTN